MSQLFPRKWSVQVISTSGQAVDLSALKFRFKTQQSDVETPNRLVLRIFNPSQDTVGQIQSAANEFNRIVLQAGYDNGGPYGIIFDGQIVQRRNGREDQITTFLEFVANDGDEALALATINTTLAAGATQQQVWDAISGALVKNGVTVGYSPPFTGVILPRGKTLYGLAIAEARLFAANQGCRLSVQNGKLVLIPVTGYIPNNAAVVLNSQTGLIGIPEQTADGISAQSLLNPNIVVGAALQINNKDIVSAPLSGTYTSIPDQKDGQSFESSVLPFIAADGIYRAVVVEHEGDTRDVPWYTHIMCFAIAASAVPGSSVASYP